MEKPYFTIDQMIEYLNNKNIMSRTMNENEIRIFLTENTYFFKLTSYRKNFNYNQASKAYTNVSFDNLVDLSNIDMRLRYLVMHFSLDLEHKLKTILLNELLTKNNQDFNDDGYAFLERFITHNENPTTIKKKILRNIERTNKSLFNNYKERIPLWVALECCEFGILESIICFYINTNPNSKLAFLLIQNSENTLLSFVRNVRNKAAHNSVILNSITKNSGTRINGNINPLTSGLLLNSNVTGSLRKNNVHNGTLHDLTSLLAIYDTLIPEGKMKQVRYKELSTILLRAKKNGNTYNSTALDQVFMYFFYIIKYLTGKKA